MHGLWPKRSPRRRAFDYPRSERGGPIPSSRTLRKKYRPAISDIRVLFVGESPPAGGTFFYAGNSKLFLATEDAFAGAMPSLRGDSFLDAFMRLGCFLDDLCLEPVDKLSNSEKRIKRREGERALSRRMKGLTPTAIVVVVIGIEPNVRRAALGADLGDVPIYALPFPGRWHRTRYVAELTALVRRFKRASVFLRMPPSA
jgi:hypothetical protein